MESTLEPDIYFRAKEILSDLKDRILINKSNIALRVESLESKEKSAKHFIDELEISKIAHTYLNELIDMVCNKNINKIEKVVNSALEIIFFDQSVSFKIKSEIKRDVPTYFVVLFNNGVEGSIDSFGGGIVAMVAFILKILLNIFSGRYPILALDESLSFLSLHYIPAASNFIRELVSEFKMILVMVTHQTPFTEFSDITYHAVKENERTSYSLLESSSYLNKEEENNEREPIGAI